MLSNSTNDSKYLERSWKPSCMKRAAVLQLWSCSAGRIYDAPKLKQCSPRTSRHLGSSMKEVTIEITL